MGRPKYASTTMHDIPSEMMLLENGSIIYPPDKYNLGKRKIVPPGTVHNMLEVIRLNHVRVTKHGPKFMYNCKCLNCGKYTLIDNSGLVNSKIVSCGCYAKEHSSRVHTKHGQTNTRLHRIWRQMKNRCVNPNEKAHFGKGIKVCEEWANNNDGFENFYKWSYDNGYYEQDTKIIPYKDLLTIDRLDNNLDYGPDNCRWVVGLKTQEQNRTNNIKVRLEDGTTIVLARLSDILGIDNKAVANRMHHHWTAYETIAWMLHPEWGLHRVNHCLVDKDGFMRMINKKKLTEEVLAIYTPPSQ